MKHPKWNQTYGLTGEQEALRYLVTQGYKKVSQNYRTFWGEIDLIMEDGRTLVFVEVKKRRDLQYGQPEEAITPGKRKHIVKAAISYLQKERETERPMRFDVISIGPDGLKHYKNAFDAEETFTC